MESPSYRIVMLGNDDLNRPDWLARRRDRAECVWFYRKSCATAAKMPRLAAQRIGQPTVPNCILVMNVHLLAHRQRRFGHVLPLHNVARGWHAIRMQFDSCHRRDRT